MAVRNAGIGLRWLPAFPATWLAVATQTIWIPRSPILFPWRRTSTSTDLAHRRQCGRHDFLGNKVAGVLWPQSITMFLGTLDWTQLVRACVWHHARHQIGVWNVIEMYGWLSEDRNVQRLELWWTAPIRLPNIRHVPRICIRRTRIATLAPRPCLPECVGRPHQVNVVAPLHGHIMQKQALVLHPQWQDVQSFPQKLHSYGDPPSGATRFCARGTQRFAYGRTLTTSPCWTRHQSGWSGTHWGDSWRAGTS